jgi:hypothetical protein
MDVFRAKTAILAVTRRTVALVNAAFFKRYGFNLIAQMRLEIADINADLLKRIAVAPSLPYQGLLDSV